MRRSPVERTNEALERVGRSVVGLAWLGFVPHEDRWQTKPNTLTNNATQRNANPPGGGIPLLPVLGSSSNIGCCSTRPKQERETPTGTARFRVGNVSLPAGPCVLARADDDDCDDDLFLLCEWQSHGTSSETRTTTTTTTVLCARGCWRWPGKASACVRAPLHRTDRNECRQFKIKKEPPDPSYQKSQRKRTQRVALLANYRISIQTQHWVSSLKRCCCCCRRKSLARDDDDDDSFFFGSFRLSRRIASHCITPRTYALFEQQTNQQTPRKSEPKTRATGVLTKHAVPKNVRRQPTNQPTNPFPTVVPPKAIVELSGRSFCARSR